MPVFLNFHGEVAFDFDHLLARVDSFLCEVHELGYRRMQRLAFSVFLLKRQMESTNALIGFFELSLMGFDVLGLGFLHISIVLEKSFGNVPMLLGNLGKKPL